MTEKKYKANITMATVHGEDTIDLNGYVPLNFTIGPDYTGLSLQERIEGTLLGVLARNPQQVAYEQIKLQIEDAMKPIMDDYLPEWDIVISRGETDKSQIIADFVRQPKISVDTPKT